MALNQWPLDANSVIESVYDIEQNALRVNTQATVTAGALEVAIDATTDSIKIGDGTDFLSINPDGSLNVNVISTSPTGSVVSTYNSVSSVPSSTLTTVVSYTIGIGMIGFLERIECSGTNIADYQVFINSVLQARKRTYFGGELSIDFDFSSPNAKGILVGPGVTIELKVEHSRPMTGDFDGRIQVTEL